MGTVLVVLILVLIVALIVWSMFKARKAGKSWQCGMDCSQCSANCNLRRAEDPTKEKE